MMCIATHYEGEPCDNTRIFHKWIKEKLENKEQNSGLLKNMRYCVFGLGDTSYEYYNTMGRFFNEAFAELGATRVFKYGEGNSYENQTEDMFNDWKTNIWNEIFAFYRSHHSLDDNT